MLCFDLVSFVVCYLSSVKKVVFHTGKMTSNQAVLRSSSYNSYRQEYAFTFESTRQKQTEINNKRTNRKKNFDPNVLLLILIILSQYVCRDSSFISTAAASCFSLFAANVVRVLFSLRRLFEPPLGTRAARRRWKRGPNKTTTPGRASLLAHFTVGHLSLFFSQIDTHRTVFKRPIEGC